MANLLKFCIKILRDSKCLKNPLLADMRKKCLKILYLLKGFKIVKKKCSLCNEWNNCICPYFRIVRVQGDSDLLVPLCCIYRKTWRIRKQYFHNSLFAFVLNHLSDNRRIRNQYRCNVLFSFAHLFWSIRLWTYHKGIYS